MGTPSRTPVWLTALVVALLQVMGSFGAADRQPDRRSLDALAILLLLVGPAALAVRDRWPLVAVGVSMAAADVYVGLGYPYGPIFLSPIVALFLAIQAGHRRATWILAAAGYAGLMVAYALDPRSDQSNAVLHFALVAGWLIVVLVVSELVRARREQAAARAQVARDERERRLGEQRLGLAQELHDVLAHNISLINVQASVALHLMDEQPAQARDALTNIKAASGDALHELRAALDVLRRGEEAPLTPAPSLADLGSLVEGVRASGLDVRLEEDGRPAALPAAVELAAYRIVQEALTNVTRHARAHAVTVRVGYDTGVTIEVDDDGVGAGDAPSEPGNGISGMRERAAALGGTLRAGPRPEGGFAVLAHLPVDAS